MTTATSDEKVELLRQMLREEAGDEALARLASGLDESGGGASEQALAHALASLETVFLVAAADGKLYRTEVDELHSLLCRLLERPLAQKHLEQLLDVFAQDLDRDDYDVRLAALSKALGDEASRRAAFVMAVGISYVDGRVQPEEQDVIDAMGKAFAIDPVLVERIVVRVRERMTAKPASS